MISTGRKVTLAQFDREMSLVRHKSTRECGWKPTEQKNGQVIAIPPVKRIDSGLVEHTLWRDGKPATHQYRYTLNPSQVFDNGEFNFHALTVEFQFNGEWRETENISIKSAIRFFLINEHLYKEG